MNDTTKLFISPFDVLFFRDGRPFDAGADNAAQSLFPPSPTTFYGTIRGAIMGQQGKNFSDFEKDKDWGEEFNEICLTDKKRTLKTTYFGLARKFSDRIERLFPIPADLYQIKHSQSLKAYTPLQLNKETSFSNLPNGLNNFRLCFGNEDNEIMYVDTPVGFLNEKGFSAYLKGGLIRKEGWESAERILMKEKRVIIKKDKRKGTSEDKFLTSIEFVRMNTENLFSELEEYGYLLETNSKKIKIGNNDLKLIRLGGEGKIAYYKVIEKELNTLPATTLSGNRFKLIFLTPAIFKDGWLPDRFSLDGKELKGTIAGISVKLVSAAIRKFIGIGGWDIKENRSKVLRRAIPPGSVYFFETLENVQQEQLINNLHFKSVHGDSNFSKEGLGLAFIGAW